MPQTGFYQRLVAFLTKTLIVSALPLAAGLFQPVNLSYYLIIGLN